MKKAFEKCRSAADKFWNSKAYMPVMLLIAVLSSAFNIALECMYVYVFICVVLLIFCDDLMSVLPPILFTLQISVAYYKDYSALTQYMWYAIVPFALAMLFNLIYYRRPTVKGRFLYPLIAVSAALIAGGIGSITLEEYTSPTGLYYMLGLGVAQVLIYLLTVSRLQNRRSYDRVERIAQLLYAAGLVFVIVIVDFYIENLGIFLEKGRVLFFKPRNYVTSVFLMAIPSVCILIKKSDLYLIGTALMYTAMVFTGSRSGLLFGTFLLVLCCIYIYVVNKKSRKLYRWVFSVALIIGISLTAKEVYSPKFYSARLENGSVGDKTRIEFIKRGITNFVEHPLFGIGIGSTKDISIFKAYVPGSLMFYHNIVIQVMSSMGLVGAAAYIWQLVLRAKTLWDNRRNELFAFAFSYAGILMMSFTNPGIFCPFPEAGLLTIIFAVIESERKNDHIGGRI